MSEERDEEEVRRLGALGAELRPADAARAPAFDHTWAAAEALARRRRSARRRQVVLVLAGTTVLAAAAAIALAVIVPAAGPASVLPGIVDPEPLGFLLARPGGAP